MTASRPERFQPLGGPLGNTRAIVLDHFQKVIGPEFLDTVDVLFAHYNAEPIEAIASYEEEKSIGKYVRVRPRIRNFLAAVAAEKSDRFSIDIGNYARRKSPAFHHGSVATSLSTSRKSRSIWFGIDEASVGKKEEFVEFVAPQLFQLVGPCYGYYLLYSKQYGIGCYVASVKSILAGGNVMAFEDYGERITRWRDRERTGFQTSQGYIREVYEVNFLLDTHLRAPIDGMTFRKLAEKLGELVPFQQCPGVYKWTVPGENLELARDQFEDSGLVLSAPAEPIPL